jgi:hypothetical protein
VLTWPTENQNDKSTKLSDIKDKMQFVVCGFDTRGTMTEINPQTGEQRQRPIKPHETVWYEYEKIFTDNYKIVTPEYKNYLEKFIQDPFEGEESENYLRVWTKPPLERNWAMAFSCMLRASSLGTGASSLSRLFMLLCPMLVCFLLRK